MPALGIAVVQCKQQILILRELNYGVLKKLEEQYTCLRGFTILEQFLCNGYGFPVRVLNYRTLRSDSGESMRTRNSLRGIYLNQRFSCFKYYFSFRMLSPIMSRAGMISLPRCVDIYTKLKLVHWTLDVHHSCSSLLSFIFKNNYLYFVQKKRKNIS